MGDTPHVTVIMATRNRAHIIGRAIRSLQEQTDPRWELLVIDDAGTDETARAVAMAHDRRIHYVRLNEQHGQGYARTVGLDYAQGHIITYLDDDNTYLPRMIEAVQRIPHEYEWGCCYCNYVNTLLEEEGIDGLRVASVGHGCSAERPHTRHSLLALTHTIDTNCFFHRNGYVTAWPDSPWEDVKLTSTLAYACWDKFWLLPWVLVEYELTVGAQGESSWRGWVKSGLSSELFDRHLALYGHELTEQEREAIRARKREMDEHARSGRADELWLERIEQVEADFRAGRLAELSDVSGDTPRQDGSHE